MIESLGFISLVHAADIMVKTASVKVADYQRTGNGLVCILVRGSVADCRAAVDAACHAVEELGELVGAHVIPCPDPALQEVLPLSLKGNNL